MTISVTLEFKFERAEEAVELLSIFQPVEREGEAPAVPHATHQERIRRSELQCAPIMNLLARELAKRGLKPVRLEDTLDFGPD